MFASFFIRCGQKFGKCFVFFSAEATIHNSQYIMCSVKLRAKDYPHADHFRSLIYNRIQHCLTNVLQLLCTNSVSFHPLNRKKYSVYAGLVLKTCLPSPYC